MIELLRIIVNKLRKQHNRFSARGELKRLCSYTGPTACVFERAEESLVTNFSALSAAEKETLLRLCPMSKSLLPDLYAAERENFRFYLSPVVPHSLNRLVFSRGITSFRTNWWKGVLHAQGNTVCSDGVMTLPFWDERSAKDKGRWSLEWLSSFMGEPVAVYAESGYADFNPPVPAPDLRSVAAWYAEWIGEGGDLPHLFLNGYSGVIDTAIAQDIVCLPAQSQHADMTVHLEKLYAPERFDTERFFDYFDYNLRPVASRSGLLSHFVKTYFPGRQDLRIVDCGGGAGFNLMELDFDSGRIGRTLNVDVSFNNILPFLRCRNAFFKAGDTRHRMRIEAAQDHAFAEECDAVLFLTSLLYVPRELLEATLDRAWESLSPGGMLVVLEHAKSPSFTRDSHCMFTVDELDGVLGRYGRIDRWHCQATLPLTAEQAHGKTVYRVVVKG
ncbi:class I SAM-dependent methyltransferase [Desulfovibrio sp. JC010]|uniref:class I SAM-dependent methyltransferase n=1 Tax=Desulfovibrio sp. JC010 TaxID=2593641 RepID=UPI0013D122D7|nr:class I SAM-dependent methyltransferase [Desulfovibrio sp. JC010]NDV27485.1 class I SAM-dependent methyltransferase [Desulfovibrio sp. JC010]